MKRKIIVSLGIPVLSLGLTFFGNPMTEAACAQSVEVTEIVPAPMIVETPTIVESPAVVERIIERPTIVEVPVEVPVEVVRPVPVFPSPVVVPGVLPGRYRVFYPYAPAVPAAPGPVYYTPHQRWMP